MVQTVLLLLGIVVSLTCTVDNSIQQYVSCRIPYTSHHVYMETLQLSHSQFLQIAANYKESAKSAHLVYVSVNDPGIICQKKGKGFCYLLESKPLRSKAEIDRIKKLAIPPAWKNVWICTLPEGHIQAAGNDDRNRKQYKYHSLWNILRNETKFHRMYEFGKALPALRTKIEEDIASKELSANKVIATVISLMERTYIRIGNEGYEKLYGSYGLTTLKDKHVEVNANKLCESRVKIGLIKALQQPVYPTNAARVLLKT